MSAPIVLSPRDPNVPMDRRGYIGSSDVSIIMGMNPWMTPYQLWEQKTAPEIMVQERTEAEEETLAMGKFVEPHIIAMAERKYGIKPTAMNVIYQDAEFDFLRCEVDVEFEETGIVNGECKSVDPFAFRRGDWGDEDSDEVPGYYAIQTLFTMSVTQRQLAKLFALYGPRHLRAYAIPRDEELVTVIRKNAVDFWHNHVLSGLPPAATTAEDAERMIAKFSGFVWEAPESLRHYLRQLKQVKGEIKVLEEMKDGYELSIKKSIAEEAVRRGVPGEPKEISLLGMDGKQMASWNQQTRSSYVVKESTFRVLRLGKNL